MEAKTVAPAPTVQLTLSVDEARKLASILCDSTDIWDKQELDGEDNVPGEAFTVQAAEQVSLHIHCALLDFLDEVE